VVVELTVRLCHAEPAQDSLTEAKRIPFARQAQPERPLDRPSRVSRERSAEGLIGLGAVRRLLDERSKSDLLHNFPRVGAADDAGRIKPSLLYRGSFPLGAGILGAA
jgi:hypothetical protein